MSETFLEKLERVRMMVLPEHAIWTWDLSEKDVEAIKAITTLAEISLLYRARDILKKDGIDIKTDFTEVEKLFDGITGASETHKK